MTIEQGCPGESEGPRAHHFPHVRDHRDQLTKQQAPHGQGRTCPATWSPTIGTRFWSKGEPPVKGPAGSDFEEPLVRDQLVVTLGTPSRGTSWWGLPSCVCPKEAAGIFLLKACG